MLDDSLIYDVGAHMGEDTDFYLRKGFKVIAIEAVPAFCEKLSKQFAQYVASRQLTVLNLALSNKSGPIDFYVNPDWVARNSSLGASRISRITVYSATLADVMKEHGIPRYCKIDIEGNDLDALKSLAGLLEPPKFISIESEKVIWDRLLDEFKTFEQLGYGRYKIVDQSLITLQSTPIIAKEGNVVDHNFSGGSSGPFGDELPGRWLELGEAIEAYKNIFRGYALNGDNGLFRSRYAPFSILSKLQQLLVNASGSKAYTSPARLLPPAGWYDTHAMRR
jgi:FkbM family methyltransferase